MKTLILAIGLFSLVACGGGGGAGGNGSDAGLGTPPPKQAMMFNTLVENMMVEVSDVTEPQALNALDLDFEDDENEEPFWAF